MKRSKELTPLSWEHHSALVNANRIKRGVAVQAAPQLIEEFLLYIWDTDLKEHFQREETNFTVHPAWKNVPEEYRQKMLNEHNELEELVNRVKNNSNPDEKLKLMDSIADIIIGHVRFEEQQLFPAIEAAYDPALLSEIGRALTEQHVPGCIHWQPSFWKKEN